MSSGCDGGVGSVDDVVIDGGIVGVCVWSVSPGCDGVSSGCDGGVGSVDDAVIDGGIVGVCEWSVSAGVTMVLVECEFGCDDGVGGV